MRSSWIRWPIAVGLLASPPAVAAERDRHPTELVNVFLAPGHAQWLVGPIGYLASDEEIETYLAITDDEEAERFIEEFWSRREPMEGIPGSTAREQFEHLAREANRFYGEDAFPGHRTDRGTIFILYGPPDKVDYKPARPARGGRYRAPPMSSRYGQVERWLYEKGRVGLDGRSPKRVYHFVRDGDLIRFADSSQPP